MKTEKCCSTPALVEYNNPAIMKIHHDLHMLEKKAMDQGGASPFTLHFATEARAFTEDVKKLITGGCLSHAKARVFNPWLTTRYMTYSTSGNQNDSSNHYYSPAIITIMGLKWTESYCTSTMSFPHALQT